MMATWRYIKHNISLSLFLAILDGCVQSDYSTLDKSELAEGIRRGSILQGIRFGDTLDFYGKCFDLNKQHILTAGPEFSAQYVFTDSLVHQNPTPIRMLLVPAFDEKEILTNLDLKFSYPGWAPWNRHLQSDRLKNKIIENCMVKRQ